MTRNRSSAKALRTVVSSALVAALVIGSAGASNLSARTTAGSGNRVDLGLSRGKLDRAVEQAEKAVAAKPADAALRLALGHAYLAAGRFESASVTFDDAVKLGDESGPTALSLALALTASGQQQTALGVLEDWRDVIPASDLGLAFALAGEAGRGVAILTDTLRGGENTAKVRQNLAYAYALDGRWREARLMASQDVPADQIDDRIGAWSLTVRPEATQARVATVLGVTPRNDSGQPQRLALVVPTATPVAPQVAAAEVIAPVTAPAPVAEPAPIAWAELPASTKLAPLPAPVPAVPTPAEKASFAAAFSGHGYVTQPTTLDARPVAARPVAAVAARKATAPRPSVAVRGTHRVQLGSFSSAANAQRAVRTFVARNGFTNAQLSVTPVVVNGRNFWRVAASGFSAGSAAQACSSVKSRGGACFAYAATKAPATSAPAAPATPTLAARGTVPRWARR